MPLEEVRIPALDRAFLLGDAVYEVIRIYGGKAFRVDEHIKRLAVSLEQMRIPFEAKLAHDRLLSTLEQSKLKEALGYIQVTRGAAVRHHTFPKGATPNCLVYVEEFLDPYKDIRQQGASVITYPDIRWRRNDIKVTSLAANCLAAEAAQAQNCLEALLVDDAGLVTEGSHTSLFAVNNGHVLVAPTNSATLPGITKSQVLTLCQNQKIPTKEGRLSKHDLTTVDELFLTATPEEIIGIVEVDGQRLKNGTPGPITQKLQQAYTQSVADWLKSAK